MGNLDHEAPHIIRLWNVVCCGSLDFRDLKRCEYGSCDRQVSCKELIFSGYSAGHLAHFHESLWCLSLSERPWATASFRGILLVQDSSEWRKVSAESDTWNPDCCLDFSRCASREPIGLQPTVWRVQRLQQRPKSSRKKEGKVDALAKKSSS